MTPRARSSLPALHLGAVLVAVTVLTSQASSSGVLCAQELRRLCSGALDSSQIVACLRHDRSQLSPFCAASPPEAEAPRS